MKPSSAVLAIAAVSVILTGSAVLGCNGKSATGPYGGGTTGGTGGTGNTPFSSGALNASASFVRLFPTAGTVGYYAATFTKSMGMTGDVTVVAGAADSMVVTASGTSFSPATVSIRPGGYVHWKLADGCTRSPAIDGSARFTVRAGEGPEPNDSSAVRAAGCGRPRRAVNTWRAPGPRDP